MSDKTKVLIVGAGGFIGGFIAEEGLRRNLDVWCGVRPSTSRRFLQNPRLHFIELDYENHETLVKTLLAAPYFDWIIWNLGATKCVNFLDFNRINYGYVRTFIDALRDSDHMPQRFVYMSSLSALGPGDEKHYTPLRDTMVPEPNTRYGLSKIKTETLLEMSSDVPWIILRPTGVYGPHEQDYLMMIKAIDRGIDFGVGFKRQLLTFIYVEDLARAIYDALKRAPLHHKYILSERRAYTQADFRKIVKKALGRSLVLPIRLPLWLAHIACTVSGKYGALQHKAVTLNPDKFRIMRQRNWDCDVSPAVNDFGFNPQVSLADGITAVVKSYRQDKKAKRKKKGGGE